MKKYWHELTTEEQTAILIKPITVGEMMDRFEQPEWCSYHEALHSSLGCWSLTGGLVHDDSICKNCDQYKPKL